MPERDNPNQRDAVSLGEIVGALEALRDDIPTGYCSKSDVWNRMNELLPKLRAAIGSELRALRERDEPFIEAAEALGAHLEDYDLWSRLPTAYASDARYSRAFEAAYRARREGMKHAD